MAIWRRRSWPSKIGTGTSKSLCSLLRLCRYSSLSCLFLDGKGNKGGTAGSVETRPWWTGIFVFTGLTGNLDNKTVVALPKHSRG